MYRKYIVDGMEFWNKKGLGEADKKVEEQLDIEAEAGMEKADELQELEELGN